MNPDVCPGPDCRMCNGEVCNLCGAGCSNSAPHCEHDVIERHEGAQPDYDELAKA